MAVQFTLAKRGGRFAVVRVLPNGDAAGYDAESDRDGEQRHFQIHRDTPHATAIDAAFGDSRQYDDLDAAITDAEASGRSVTA